MVGKNKHTGELGELKVAAKITELGGQVSFPHGDSCGYDLLADVGGKVTKVQVKSSTYQEGNSWSISCSRGHASKTPYSAADCELIVCSVPYGYYVIPVAVLKNKVKIRLWEPGTNRYWKKTPSCKYEEYREAWHLLKP